MSAVALFVLSVGLLIIELVPVPGIRPGLSAAASLIVVALGAPLIHRQRIRPIQHLVVPLAIASGTLSIARWPEPFPGTPAATAIQVLSISCLVWLLAKMLLLQRFSAVTRSRALPEEELARLLEFQKSDLESLERAILADARVVQLVGVWGQGKSFLIERLGVHLQHRDRDCAVVVINVWEQQTEPDLHLAIVEEVLSHEKYWYPYGWLYYPFSLFVARAAKELHLTFSAGAATKAKIQLPIALPRPTGRRYLEQQVARVSKQGTRTVIVLDEIDRAAPRMAQSAITLARRSLDMPGVVVVLSYVDQLIRYKAFNPLVRSLPDLESTMHAVIFDQGPENAFSVPQTLVSPPVSEAPGGPLTIVDPLSLRSWKAWEEAAEAELFKVTGSASSNTGEAVTLDDQSRLAETLRLAYANADVNGRRRLQALFSEKYLGTTPIHLQTLPIRDVGNVVVRFKTLRGSALKLLGIEDLGDATTRDLDDLVGTITSALEQFQQSAGSSSRAMSRNPSLRRLEGELSRRLYAVNSDSGGFSRQFIAAVVLAAYDAAIRSGP